MSRALTRLVAALRRATRTHRTRDRAALQRARVEHCARHGHAFPIELGRVRLDLPCRHCHATVVYAHLPAAVASVLTNPRGVTSSGRRPA